MSSTNSRSGLSSREYPSRSTTASRLLPPVSRFSSLPSGRQPIRRLPHLSIFHLGRLDLVHRHEQAGARHEPVLRHRHGSGDAAWARCARHLLQVRYRADEADYTRTYDGARWSLAFDVSHLAQGLVQFIVRLAGIIGGVIVCSSAALCLFFPLFNARAGYAWRVGHFGVRMVKRQLDEQAAPGPAVPGGREVIFTSEKHY
jgi:hypothetical protein